MGILAALFVVTASACTITTEDPGYVPPPPLPPLEQLEQAALVDPAEFRAGQDVLSFITEDRNIVCSLTSAKGEHLNLPYELNSFTDSANDKLATVPAAHCELAAYPKPAAGDIKDDCAGTGLGYLGGPLCSRRTRPRTGMPFRCHTNGGDVRAQGGQERPAQ